MAAAGRVVVRLETLLTVFNIGENDDWNYRNFLLLIEYGFKYDIF